MAKKFPDLTGDGKVTQADVLKGRGVFSKGSEVEEKQKQYIRDLLASQMISLMPNETEAEAKARQARIQRELDAEQQINERLFMEVIKESRDDMSMGSLMMPPEREGYVAGALASLKRAIFKPKTKQAKALSEKLQNEYKPEDLEEAVQELVDIVEANTQVNKKGKADLKITKSNLITEASNNLMQKDVFMPTDDLERILKLDNIREGSGGKTDNLYDSIIQLAASKLEEPSLMGQFVGDIAGASTRGDRATALSTGVKTAVGATFLSNLDRLPQAVQNLYSGLNPSEKERLEKEFGEAFKQGLDEFIFIDDEGNKRPIAVKLAADDNPDVVYERVEKNIGALVKALAKKFAKEPETQGFKKLLSDSEYAKDTVEEAQRDKFFADIEEKEKDLLIAQFAKQIGGYSRKDILKLQKEDDKQQVIFDLIDELVMGRDAKGHGGSSGVAILMPAEYKEPPVDTYDNISPEEKKQQEKDMLPDEEMEEEYMDYVAEEVLTEEEQDYLFKALDDDSRLEEILDKVMLNATEFTGAGEVEGPGTGISDSIPARLSDGEFVFTRKATDQIGADKLQKMMDDAEREFDQRKGKADGGMPIEGMERFDMEKDDEEVLNRQMANANRMPSLMNR